MRYSGSRIQDDAYTCGSDKGKPGGCPLVLGPGKNAEQVRSALALSWPVVIQVLVQNTLKLHEVIMAYRCS